MSTVNHTGRIWAIDRMRGFVLILMAFDHAGLFFTEGYCFFEAPFSMMPTPEITWLYLVRGLTHFGPPAFLFLSGMSIALSSAKREQKGESLLWSDFHLSIRGVLLILIDIFVITFFMSSHMLMLKILFTIGACMILMVPIRRIFRAVPWYFSGLLITFLALFSEFITQWVVSLNGGMRTGLIALFFSGGKVTLFGKTAAVAYPIFPWLLILALGWVFGKWIVKHRDDTKKIGKIFLLTGLYSIVLFLFTRGLNHYGNMTLLRTDNSLLQWLHLSKYPPSFTYISYGVGMTLLGLWVFFWIERWIKKQILLLSILHRLGQAPLFFYVGHFALLWCAATLLHMKPSVGIEGALIGTIVLAFVLTPCCAHYQRFRSSYPKSPLRYF